MLFPNLMKYLGHISQIWSHIWNDGFLCGASQSWHPCHVTWPHCIQTQSSETCIISYHYKEAFSVIADFLKIKKMKYMYFMSSVKYHWLLSFVLNENHERNNFLVIKIDLFDYSISSSVVHYFKQNKPNFGSIKINNSFHYENYHTLKFRNFCQINVVFWLSFSRLFANVQATKLKLEYGYDLAKWWPSYDMTSK